MKIRIILIFLVLINMKLLANMASPITEGTLGASPFISQYVDIIKENILIVPDCDFETAQFIIEYYIKANKSGVQIPLLFYASEYSSDFKVWLDDAEIPFNPVPRYYEDLEGTLFEDFRVLFDSGNESNGQVEIDNSKFSTFYVSVNNLKFFEADLSEGTHSIRVEYIAESWSDRSDWVTEYSFRYALAPAKYWKSFGELEITLDAKNFSKKLETNLGDPLQGDLETVATWKFSGIPTEMIHVAYIPELSSTAKTLMTFGPQGLTYIFAGVLVSIHLLLMYLFRKRNPSARFSWVMITGSILVPLIVLIGYILSYGIIDASIGKDAAGRHVYTFMALLLYPAIMPFYLLLMWLIDWVIRKN